MILYITIYKTVCKRKREISSRYFLFRNKYINFNKCQEIFCKIDKFMSVLQIFSISARLSFKTAKKLLQHIIINIFIIDSVFKIISNYNFYFNKTFFTIKFMIYNENTMKNDQFRCHLLYFSKSDRLFYKHGYMNII